MKLAWFIAIGVFAAWRAIAGASALTEEQLLQIRFEQKLGAQISGDLVFRDDTGKTVRLGDYFGRKPLVLILGYYGCPMLCTLVLNGAVESFQNLKWQAGNQFDVVFVSIDPAETPALAAAKKRNCLVAYRRGDGAGWHFLTGEAPAIAALAGEVGFHFLRDPATGQFAHPSGIVVLTPQGRPAHYFFGVTYSAADLNAALRDAAGQKVGSPVESLVLLCFHYAPWTGKYGHLVMDAVRAAGVATVLALGVLVFRPSFQRKPPR